MAFTAKLYGLLLDDIFDGTITLNWESDTVKLALATSAYTPDQDAHDFFNDITNEVSGGGYTSGGHSLASKTSTYTGASNVIALDSADLTITTFTATYRTVVVYKSTGTASTSPLILYEQESADQTGGGGDYTFVVNASGWATYTVS